MSKHPCLASLSRPLPPPSKRVPDGARWIHEIKFDGYRVQVQLANNDVTIFTRRGYDWTKRFQKIAGDAWHVKAGSAINDGEVVVPSADGATGFAVLQNELKGKSTKLVLVAFDLPYLDGQDLRRLPLTARKAAFKKIIAGSDIQFSESFTVSSREIFAHACKLGLEGVVSKVADSSYLSGRSRAGSRYPVRSARHCQSRDLRKMVRNGMGCMSAGKKARILSMRAKSTMASIRLQRPNCAGA